VGKFWVLLFLLVPLLGAGLFIVAADADSWPLYGYWFPEDVSQYGHIIDGLFMVILWLTGIVFLGTELALVWYLWRYDASSNPEAVKYTHGSHNLEVVWTILPAATLLFIAIYQMNAWAETKVREPQDPGLHVNVTARQFEWRLRYPGKDGILGTSDDVHAVNDLHIPLDEDILVQLESADVLHSFFLPNLRVKQDAVPGMSIPVWFRATKPGTYDLVCAELCGWGHYKMKGRLTVEPRNDFDAWLAQVTAEQNRQTTGPQGSSE
jgi:cytochrome c oxidase subunit 2